jgi:hypothetical protein
MRRLLILTCLIAVLGCSSTDGLKIVSPSAPENEAKEEISKAPVTKFETISAPEHAADRKTLSREPAAEAGKTETEKGVSDIKIVSPSTPENEAKKEIGMVPVMRHGAARTEAEKGADAVRGETAPSVPTEHSLEALISLLEKKGVIKKQELLDEIKELENSKD